MRKTIDFFDLEELVYVLCSVPVSEQDAYPDLDACIFARYGVGLDEFEAIANDLIRLTPVVKTALTETMTHAFVKNGEIVCRINAE
jgi:hypothetical protein